MTNYVCMYVTVKKIRLRTYAATMPNARTPGGHNVCPRKEKEMKLNKRSREKKS